MNYFLEEGNKTTVSFIETNLILTKREVQYIYKFISTMHKAMPDYSYDFDLIKNNSESHISSILHDANRMAGDKSAHENYSFTAINNLTPNYKRINDSYVLLTKKEKLEFHGLDFNKVFYNEKFILIIVLSVILSIFFFVTLYQILYYFFPKIYLPSFYKSIQFYDFLILFVAGLTGFIIVLLDLFSNQALLRNNFQFLYLFPLHILAAFTVYKTLPFRRIRIIYWSTTSFLSLFYILITSLINKELSVVSIFFVLPLFLRTLYFDFLAIDIKKILANKKKAGPHESKSPDEHNSENPQSGNRLPD
ncbi:MAG: hypothetical protein K5873_09175 [Treponema sp.]|nr:hypothetical protein [Treponema sp.]